MSGYFQRLAQRSGLRGQPRSEHRSQPSPAPISEVDEVREVTQPAVATPGAQSSASRLSTATRTYAPVSVQSQPQAMPDRTDDGLSSPNAPLFAAQAQSSVEAAPAVDTALTDNHDVRSSLASDDTPVQFDGTPQAPVAEEPQPFDLAEPGIDTQVVTALAPTSPAETTPSFIHEVETRTEQERVQVTTEVAAEAEPGFHEPSDRVEPDFLQATVRIDPSPAPRDVPVDTEASSQHGSGPRIQIGQIQVEVQAPPGQPTAQAAVRPAPRPSPPARAPARDADLRRYYLRGF